MPDKDEIARLRAETDIVRFIGSFVALKKQGHEHVGICPFHDERTPSFKVNENKQIWTCFGACNTSGDVFDFVQRKNPGMSFNDAFDIVSGGAPKVDIAEPRADPEVFKVIDFDDRPPATHPFLGEPDISYDYRRATGKVYFRVVRWNATSNAKKEIRQLCRLAPGSVIEARDKNGKFLRMRTLTKEEYQWRGIPPAARGVYNADKFAAATKIIVCEGEKAAAAIDELFADLDGAVVGTTWIGGSGAFDKWSIAEHLPTDKQLILWADNDIKGRKAMRHISEQLLKRGQAHKAVIVPKGAEQGWDAADALAQGLKRTDLRVQDIKQAPQRPTSPSSTAPAPNAPTKPQKPAPAPTAPPSAQSPPKPAKMKASIPKSCIPLGYDGGGLYFWDAKTASVLRCRRTSSAVQGILLMLADARHWEDYFGEPPKRKVNWVQAVSAITRACESVGTFNGDKIKGRGVFLDGKKAVLNTGRALLTDVGEVCQITEQGYKFNNFYSVRQAGGSIPLSLQTPPAADADVTRIAKVLYRMGWATKESAIYLFGWMAISVICGALSWRPHIWISGASGSGKSWVMNNIIRRCLGDFALAVAGNTSEASLRWSANDESRPIVFDEAESKRRNDAENMQEIIRLARATSSADGARIMKAGNGGDVITYSIRSCFLFSSITMPLSEAADVSRFVNLALLRQALTGKEFDAVSQEMQNYPDDFWAQWCIRAFKKTRQILAAGAKFTTIMRDFAGDQRIGDTRGILLAGAWAMLAGNDAQVTSDSMRAFFETWQIKTRRVDITNFSLDDENVIDHICSYICKFPADEGGQKQMTIGEMVENGVGNSSIPIETKILAQHGIRVSDDKDVVWIAKNQYLSKAFVGTSWEGTWHEVLKQRDGVNLCKGKNKRFGGTTKNQYLSIPIDKIIKQEDSNGN